MLISYSVALTDITFRDARSRDARSWDARSRSITGVMKLGKFIDPLDVMNHANGHRHTMIILRASGYQKRGFAFEMHLALTLLCATALASAHSISTAWLRLTAHKYNDQLQRFALHNVSYPIL
jgi:hypothetical protein